MNTLARSELDRPREPSFCIGVDVGGTFTDVVLSDGIQVWRAKAPSSTAALGEGVIAGCRLVAQRAGMTLEALLPRVVRFGLGTTAVTNVIAARTGRRVGLITTSGFEDLVPIARVRRVPRDGWLVPPDGLIERDWIVGVDERIDRNGNVLRALVKTEAVAAARRLIERDGIEAIAVSFLWSCVNPVHEQQAVRAIVSAFPQVPVVSGAALHPMVREYERTTFALLNAYASGALNGVDELVDSLEALGLPHPPLLVHSGGGSISVAEGRRAPATLAESGPAAGVVGALAVSRAAGVMQAVACDMGGTSFDMSIIRDGDAMRRTRGDLMGVWTALSMVDIESVTAGGGSIGWVDSMGFLRVGPLSAGARPGPACYGRGGSQATVTDALVVLGYIDPGQFLGGDMRLDGAAAHAACAEVGHRIGSDTIQAAWGIWEIAKVEMVRALRAQFEQYVNVVCPCCLVQLRATALFGGRQLAWLERLTRLSRDDGAAQSNRNQQECRQADHDSVFHDSVIACFARAARGSFGIHRHHPIFPHVHFAALIADHVDRVMDDALDRRSVGGSSGCSSIFICITGCRLSIFQRHRFAVGRQRGRCRLRLHPVPCLSSGRRP